MAQKKAAKWAPTNQRCGRQELIWARPWVSETCPDSEEPTPRHPGPSIMA
ncbi:hypothetical protein CCACVL1_24112 [Corchorus capsularis]|uniref:Uncharacterized protein n=1 Tax=Corchorus capsularis TaxID=210143 RepID=A0A1R3GR74_COCAP|nr:hypothetical protein CCACVL1_24112 [Corchorus capsularis]